ncbi:hypothetical protein CBD41_03545 [bacterium TMED181]|nr:hypothetical protein [Planctomycetota bacterium]OUW45735.1 MAG: hypothetical protein CBD41_03545 [bacterium TMED181]
MNMKYLETASYFFAATAVTCSALGAHLMKDQWHDSNAADQFTTATRILFWHAIGVWICCRTDPPMRIPGIMMAISTVVFSGSVFALSLGASSSWAQLAPLGGSGLILSWIWMGLSHLRGFRAARG